MALPLGVALAGCDPSVVGAIKDKEFKCIETARELAGLDVTLPEGGTVRDRVGMALGTHAFVFRVPENQKSVTTYTPDSNGVKGSLGFAFGAGKIRYIEAKKPKIPKGLLLALFCPNRLEVDVSMNFRSEDGAFTESLNSIRCCTGSSNPQKTPTWSIPNGSSRRGFAPSYPFKGEAGPSLFAPPRTSPRKTPSRKAFASTCSGKTRRSKRVS